MLRYISGGNQKQWSRYGAEYFWTADRIRHIIKDERYTGTMVSLKTDAVTVRGKRRKQRNIYYCGYCGRMLYSFAERIELTEEIKEKLINKVKIYADNRIEICWKFGVGFSDADTVHRCG